MNELEQAKLLSIASKFAKAEAEEIRREIIQEFYDYFQGPNYELEKAKLLSIASKFVKSEANEVRTSLEQSLLDVEQRILEKVLQYVPEIKGGQQGERGFKGDRGDTGIPGENGAPGPRGDTGQQGLPGKDGARGPQGDTGGVGPKGDKGDQGERGEQGEQGIPGQRGQRGERGEQGLAGVDGASGRDGSDGAKGETGERGPEGVPGRDGKDGKDGSVGPKGPKGPKGDKGDPGSDADVTKLEKKLEQFTQTIDKRISKVAFNVATAGGPAGSGEVLLHRLDDVDYSSVKTPIPGQALVWNGNINKWQANTITTGGGAGSINVGKILANGVYIDTVANVTDLYFDDDSGFDVVDLGYGVAKVQMNSTFKYWNVNGSAGLTAVGLDTANFIAGSGMIISANPSNNSITFSATGVSSNVSLSTYLQVANANAKFATKAYAASNVYVKTLLANTNAYIATKVNTSTFNSALANTNNYIATKADTSTFNSALANTNSFIKLQLANTNASIASRATWASLISENTALRLLISDRLQVTNAISTYQTIATERAVLANTNAFIKTQLANTNSYIASRASWSGLTDTNTAIRILVNDRLQIANAINTYQTIAIERAALANTNAFIKAQLANTNARFSSYLETVTAASIYATKAYAAANSYVNTTSANTNAYILSVRNDERAALANTNAFIKAQLANTNAYIATKITNAVSTTLQTRDIIPEANVTYNLGSSTRRFKTLYISGDTIVLGSANLSSTGNKLQVGGQTQASNDYLTSTYIANTTARTLINDRYQVANVNTNFLSKTLNGTSSQTIQSNIEFSANVHIEGKLTVTGGITTYSANNLSVSDNMIYLNAGSVSSNPDLGITGNYNDGTYHHAGFFRDASDNGTWKVFENYAPEPDANVYINTAHATFRLAPFSAQNIRVTRNLTVVANSTLGNTSVAGFLKLNGTDIRTTFAQNTYVNSTLANTNAYIATKVNTTTFNSALANTNSYIATKVDTSTFNSALANTNAYIGTQATRISLVNTNLTGTNTALHTLISDRLQVANAVATYQTKAVERAALANTNAYIGAQATRITLVNTNLIGTNTALRTLINDRLQVTNAVATYQTKATERAALANTNAFIRAQLANTNAYIGTRASWAGLTSTNTALRTLIDDRLQVANASTTYATKISPTTSGVLAHTGRATISTNLTVSGNTSVVGLLANNSLGTAGYVLKTNGTNAYWDVAPTGGGGGGGGGGSATVTS